MRRKLIPALAALGATVALAVGGVAQAAPAAKTIARTVGPGFTITVAKKSVKAGKYTFVIQDKSSAHNWHITGPGVNKSTTVSFVGTKRITVTLKKGTYKIVCDPHASSMKTTLKVT
jgi:plastocyanin